MEPIQLSGCAIINEAGELLLLWKIKAAHYEFPGGKIEPGETREEAARRECCEELGVTVKLGIYLGYEDFVADGRRFHSHKFVGTIPEGEEPRVNEPEKFAHLRWLPISRYEEFACAPNVREFCQNYLAGTFA